MKPEIARRVSRAARQVRHFRAPLKIVLPTVAALGAGTAVAVGSIPSSNGTITGCYQTVGQSTSETGPYTPYGALRVIDPSLSASNVPSDEYSCISGREAPISWNQQGPQGPQGPAGQAGQAGQPGAQGPEGPPGTVSGQSGRNSEIFLKLANVQGESTQKGHEGDIALGAFVLHMASSGNGLSTGAGAGKGAGKLSAAAFTIVKALDKSSPALFLDLASGKVISSAEIVVLRRAGAGGNAVELADYKLTDVIITNVDESSTAEKPTETISGKFRSIKFTSFTQNQKGGVTSNSAGWDLTKNKAFLR